MKNLLSIIALLALSTAIAVADDAAEESGDDVKAEEQDCSQLEGDAKTECEKAKAEAEPPVEEEKGGKAMKKDNNNRMEAFDEDE